MPVSRRVPVLLALLPDTRRVAKVRTIHLWRGFVYSLAWITWLAALQNLRLLWFIGMLPATFPRNRGSWNWGYTTYAVDETFYREMNLPACVLIFAWLAAWWLCCIKDGLRFNRALVVWGVLMVPVALVVVIVLAYTEPSIWMWLA